MPNKTFACDVISIIIIMVANFWQNQVTFYVFCNLSEAATGDVL